MSKRTPGLECRAGNWHIKKMYRGKLIRESCRTSSLEEAQEYLALKLNEIRRADLFGERPARTFRQAATKFLNENQHKKSISDDTYHLVALDPYIGDQDISRIHSGSFAKFINDCKEKNLKPKSINLALGVARHILNIAASEWIDDHGLTWLQAAPKIKMLPLDHQAKSYPLDWNEQQRLFEALPPHLANMALFKVNTGTREQEVCKLKWSWLHEIPEINAQVFIIPAEKVKNKEDRLIVLNRVARSIIQNVIGNHDEYVFVYDRYQKGNPKPIGKMNNTAWKKAWRKAGLPVNNEFKRGVHNLKHTFGRRLRAAGVHHETRQVLLGHTNKSITTHYSAPEIQELIDAVEKVCDQKKGLTLLRVVR